MNTFRLVLEIAEANDKHLSMVLKSSIHDEYGEVDVNITSTNYEAEAAMKIFQQGKDFAHSIKECERQKKILEQMFESEKRRFAEVPNRREE